MLGRIKRLVKQARAAAQGPWMTRDRLARELRRLGVQPGGVLLVHSSLSSLGFVPGGAETVIAALGDALGPGGTLLLPAHSWAEMSRGTRRFDARATRSCVGEVTEVFRRQRGTVRSLHPTHSVAARGPLAVELTAGHELAATPCGDGTPYARLIERGGQILFLGCGLERNTVYHTLEAQARLGYLLLDEDDQFTLIDEQGAARERPIRRHRPGVARRFHETGPWLESTGTLRRGPIGRAECLLVDARRLAEVVSAQLAHDERFLLASGDSGAGQVE